MKGSKLYKNIITGFGGQLITIILGIIVPRIFISSYGSDVNGLLSTVSQIFVYLALLEAGIGEASRNSLYKPIKENDQKSVSEILTATRRYFGKFTFVYAAGVVVLAILLPFVLKTNVEHFTVFLIVLIEGLANVISFSFIQTPYIFLAADGKSYINNEINLLNKIIGYCVRIVMASFGLNIIILQLTHLLVTVLKIAFYELYLRKKYSWINTRCSNTTLELKDKNSYIIEEVCWTVFSSTDMVVLSALVSTELSSVYSVYNMIFMSVGVLLNSVYFSINYILGYSFHDDIEKYKIVHDNMNSVFMGIMTSFMVVTNVLCIPFLKLYTAGINDVNYIVEDLPMLFCLVQLLSWSRYVSGNLIGVAGRMKKAELVNIAEASVNIVLSVILVQRLGIVGALLGTVLSLPIKVIYCNYIGDRIIMKRSIMNTVKILGSNYIFFFVITTILGCITFNTNTYFSLVLSALIILPVVLSVNILMNIVINPKVKGLLNQIIHNKLNSRKNDFTF